MYGRSIIPLGAVCLESTCVCVSSVLQAVLPDVPCVYVFVGWSVPEFQSRARCVLAVPRV